MKLLRKAYASLSEFFSDEVNPEEPIYDPVHLGTTLVVTLTALGVLYWLFWTLFVYEGGIFLKLRAISQLLFESKSLQDLGYEGFPYALGAFEGTLGNFGALFLLLVLVFTLRHLYLHAARKQR